MINTRNGLEVGRWDDCSIVLRNYPQCFETRGLDSASVEQECKAGSRNPAYVVCVLTCRRCESSFIHLITKCTSWTASHPGSQTNTWNILLRSSVLGWHVSMCQIHTKKGLWMKPFPWKLRKGFQLYMERLHYLLKREASILKGESQYPVRKEGGHLGGGTIISQQKKLPPKKFDGSRHK